MCLSPASMYCWHMSTSGCHKFNLPSPPPCLMTSSPSQVYVWWATREIEQGGKVLNQVMPLPSDRYNMKCQIIFLSIFNRSVLYAKKLWAWHVYCEIHLETLKQSYIYGAKISTRVQTALSQAGLASWVFSRSSWCIVAQPEGHWKVKEHTCN